MAAKGVFDNLVKFVYKFGKNWQTRAWDPVFKTAGSADDAAMILGLFSPKNLKINIYHSDEAQNKIKIKMNNSI
jgi:hypothetical protein